MQKGITKYAATGVLALVVAASAGTTVFAQSGSRAAENRHRIPAPEEIDSGQSVRPNTHGDDAVACQKAQEALAKTGSERARGLERAREVAATSTMRDMIASGTLPVCPPPGSPRTQLEPGATVEVE